MCLFSNHFIKCSSFKGEQYRLQITTTMEPLKEREKKSYIRRKHDKIIHICIPSYICNVTDTETKDFL